MTALRGAGCSIRIQLDWALIGRIGRLVRLVPQFVSVDDSVATNAILPPTGFLGHNRSSLVHRRPSQEIRHRLRLDRFPGWRTRNHRSQRNVHPSAPRHHLRPPRVCERVCPVDEFGGGAWRVAVGRGNVCGPDGGSAAERVGEGGCEDSGEDILGAFEQGAVLKRRE